MAKAARAVEGHHDFAAFQAVGSETQSTEREVFSSRIVSTLSTRSKLSTTEVLRVLGGGELIVYEITGDGFLRHMVRTIVGTLVEIGRGRRSVGSMEEAIRSRDRRTAGPTAPPEGLFLVRVAYKVGACG